MSPSRNPELCWLFVDTTGLVHERDEVIGVAYARGGDAQYMQFTPRKPYNHTELARTLGPINGYNSDTWADEYGAALDIGLGHVQRALSGATLAGHTLIWHSLFLRQALKEIGLGYPYLSERRLSLEVLFVPFALRGVVDGLSLGSLAKSMGVPLPTPANAWDRLSAARDVYDLWCQTLGLV